MKSIYIILLSTNSKMGSLIRLVTRYKYNHVAISLSEDLSNMYSFARYKEHSALVGGFIHEKTSRYINRPPFIKVFKLDLSNESFNKIEEKIKNMEGDFNKYIYNTYSAILFPIKKRVKIKNAFTCFEFAEYILDEVHLEGFRTIKEMDQKLSSIKIFEGRLDKFIKLEEDKNDDYFEKMSFKKVATTTVNHFIELSKRYFEWYNKTRMEE